MADLELDGPNSAISVDTLKPKTATTLTLGENGDTIALGSGATSTGFGATYNGAVNWQSAIKTSDFTAVSGEGYFVNTTSGAITVTLPASPSAGAIVAIKDYAGTFASNNLTIARNSSNIQGSADDSSIETNRASVVLVFADSTKGWLYTNESNVSDLGAPTFLAATGGTVTTSGNFKIHTFTSTGTFTVTDAGSPGGSNTVDYLVVAGGASGGAGMNAAAGGGGGGGGAGGYRESYPNPATGGLSVSAQAYPITIGGGGGAQSSASTQGNPGSNSVFSSVTSAGGGGGGKGTGSYNGVGADGGSGGGGGGTDAPAFGGAAGGSGNTPSVSPPQGNNGGSVSGQGTRGGAGGGGHAAAGSAGASSPTAGPGGGGTTSTITGSPVGRAGGGGGGQGNDNPGGAGSQGGGDGGDIGAAASAGTANTGGGGGGGSDSSGGITGAAGGSGVVVIRYKFQ
jgi:hypothetical protein